jgi:asparaginyl-tRNA synthetase
MTESHVPTLDQLAEIRHSVLSALRAHFDTQGLTETRVPTIVNVTGACENVVTLFGVVSAGASVKRLDRRLKRRHRHGPPDQPDKPLLGYLTQTGQLALEHLLSVSSGCWCHTGSYRYDNLDQRHLQEFELIEEEFAWNHPSIAAVSNGYDPGELFEALLSRVTTAIKIAIAAVDRKLITKLAATCDHLDSALESPFARYEYDEALDIANHMRAAQERPQLSWGSDLKPIDEQTILRHASQGSGDLPVFVTHFPQEIKFFNMKVDLTDPRRVLSADLLLPFAGEAAGAAVREDHYPTLHHRLETSAMLAVLQAQRTATIETFEPYLRLVRLKQTPPHAGYGLGLERLLQFLSRANDIRDVSLPARLAELSGDNANVSSGSSPRLGTKNMFEQGDKTNEDSLGLSPFAEEAMSWYYQPAEPRETLSKRRVIAWLETPNALITATRVAYPKVPTELLAAARATVDDTSFREWRSIVEAQEGMTRFLKRVKRRL